MKSKSESILDVISFFPFGGMFDLTQGEVEKVFINTKEAHYMVSNNQVICTMETFLKVRYKSGKSQIIRSHKAEGVAKCAPDDKFNLLTGIKLATARAENDYNTYYSKLIRKYLISVDSFADELEYLQENCESQLVHNSLKFIPSLIEKK